MKCSKFQPVYRVPVVMHANIYTFPWGQGAQVITLTTATDQLVRRRGLAVIKIIKFYIKYAITCYNLVEVNNLGAISGLMQIKISLNQSPATSQYS